MSVEFKEGAVCYFDGEQHFSGADKLEDSQGYTTSFYNALNYADFQLNTPTEGWYIHKSEIDTEQKYNDVVEVFGLFGFERKYDFNETTNNRVKLEILKLKHNKVCDSDLPKGVKCTYSQLMAIGKLKRMIDEKENNLTHKLFRKLKSALEVGDFQEVEDIQSKILRGNSIIQDFGYSWDDDGSFTVKGRIESEEWKPTIGEEVEAVFGDINSMKGKLLALTKEYAIIQQDHYEQHLHLKEWILKEPQSEEDVIRERVKDLFTGTIDSTREHYSSKELAEYLLDVLYVSGYKIVEESDCE